MALFKKSSPKPAERETKPKAEVAKKEASAEAPVAVLEGTQKGLKLGEVLLRPHVTEKATDLSEHNVYAFEVHKFANKMQVRQAVEKLYKVKPRKVAVINEKPKFTRSQRTGRTQVKEHAMKKALVYLKAGDKIEFV